MLTKEHVQLIIEAHEIRMDEDDEETQLLDQHNPELADAYRELLAFAEQ